MQWGRWEAGPGVGEKVAGCANPAFRLFVAGTLTACGTQAAPPPDGALPWPDPGVGPGTRAPSQPPSQPLAQPLAQPLPQPPSQPLPQPLPSQGQAPGLARTQPDGKPGQAPGGPTAPPGTKEPPASDTQQSSKVKWSFDEMAPGPLDGAQRADQAVGAGTWRNFFDASWHGSDGRDERPPWVVRGNWEIAAADRPGMSGHVLRQTETRAEPVASFVQPPWPAGGGAPARYRVAVSVAADAAPRGQESPLLVWFQDVQHYAEVIAKPRSVEVWTSDGAVPDRAEGWERAWYKSLVTAPGEVRRLEAVVDVKAGRMTVWVDGERLGEATVPLISRPATYTIALRATGGPIAYDDLEVEALP